MKTNEIELSKDISIITAEINSYKQIAGQSIWEIGRRLNYVKENDLAHGEFGKWLDSISMNHHEANRFMKVVKELPNSTTYNNLGSNALYLITTLPEEERTKEHTTSKGETKTPDEMTVRELKDLKKQLKEKDSQLSEKDKQLKEHEERIEELELIGPEIVEKKIEVEKIPEDYQKLKLKASEVDDLVERNRRTEEELRKLHVERQEVEEKSAKYDKLSKAIQQAEGKLSSTQQLIHDYKKLSDLIEKSNEFITLSGGLVYLDLASIFNHDGLAKREFGFMIERLERFLNDLKAVGNNEILEGEIINE